MSRVAVRPSPVAGVWGFRTVATRSGSLPRQVRRSARCPVKSVAKSGRGKFLYIPCQPVFVMGKVHFPIATKAL